MIAMQERPIESGGEVNQTPAHLPTFPARRQFEVCLLGRRAEVRSEVTAARRPLVVIGACKVQVHVERSATRVPRFSSSSFTSNDSKSFKLVNRLDEPAIEVR